MGVFVSALRWTALGGLTMLAAPPVAAAAPTGAVTAPAEQVALLLEVRLNGRQTGLILSFRQDADGELSADAAELATLRIVAPLASKDGRVRLRDVPGLAFTFDEQQQAIAITLAPERLAPAHIEATSFVDTDDTVTNTASSTGAVLNYSLFAGTSAGGGWRNNANGSAAINGRFYAPFGEVTADGVIAVDGRGVHALRLDTRLTAIDAARDVVLNVGDTISNSLPWSRSIRFGGIQLQHDFTLRPDLVTVPIASLSGSAAVPSSLDIYMNGTHRLSADVAEGRYLVDNLPAVTGPTTTRLVLRDIQGREVETRQSFFVSDRQLRDGLRQFSLEAGVARQRYGVESFDYDPHPFAMATGRAGLANGLTVEAHGEVSAELLMAGAGLTLPAGDFAVLSFATSASRSAYGIGRLGYASLETGVGAFRLIAEVIGTSSAYADLAAITSPQYRPGRPGSGLLALAIRPAALTVRASASLPAPLIGGNVNVSYAEEKRRDADDYRTLAAYYGRTLNERLSVQTSVLLDLERRGNNSMFAGLNLALGRRTNATLGVTSGTGPVQIAFDAAQSVDLEPGSIGWRVSDVEGARRFRSATVLRRGAHADVQAQLAQTGGTSYGSLSVDGALVVDGGVYASRPLVGAFAIVDAGAPDVPILHQNRLVGRTNARGRLLVPDIRPFERAYISLDITALPLDTVVTEPSQRIRPTGLGGVRVRFKVDRKQGSALLHLVDEAGADLPVGATVANTGTDLVIGYDGLVMVDGLKARNRLAVRFGTAQCTAEFAFHPGGKGEGLQRLGPITCARPTLYAAKKGS
jgi:outer membrane usher protein